MACEAIQLNIDKITKAVSALRKITSEPKKGKELLESVDDVEIQICLKKIPPKEKTIKLKLPHSLKKADVEVCLFVKDLDRSERDYEGTVRHFQDDFKKKGVTSVTEIIPLKSLKTEYKPYEAKRNLSNAYDIFLADARIVRLLPPYLGKHFYGRKRAPVQVNLMSKYLSSEIDDAIGNSRCRVSPSGSVNTAVVAHLKMEDREIAENVIASANQISANIAGGALNVKLICLKLKRSTSIPIYIGKGGPQDVTIPREIVKEDVEAEEISTVFGAKVKVYPDGKIVLVKDGEAEEVDEEKGAPKPTKAKTMKQKPTGKRLTGKKRTLKSKSTRPQKKLK